MSDLPHHIYWLNTYAKRLSRWCRASGEGHISGSFFAYQTIKIQENFCYKNELYFAKNHLIEWRIIWVLSKP